MRIRKQAWKILGTASPLPPPQSPPALLGDVSSSRDICVLNQSPWDVFSSPPPQNPQDEGTIGDWINGEELISVTSNTTFVAEDMFPNKPNPAPVLKKVKKTKEKMKDEHVESTARAPAYICKKTDGKQWRCRRPAPQPNSLCDYHLAQIRSYNYKAPLVAKAANVGKSTRRKRVTMPAATSLVSDIYYYSSFDPWRGKHRGGGDIGQQGSVVADADGGSDREKESYVNMDVSDDDESWEDSEQEEKQTWNDTNPHMGSRKKRRRKPVKSRSLKSLM